MTDAKQKVLDQCRQRGVTSPFALGGALSCLNGLMGSNPGQLIPYCGSLADMMQNAYQPPVLSREDCISIWVEQYRLITNDRKFMKARPKGSKWPHSAESYRVEAWLREWGRRFQVQPMGGER